MINSSRTPTLKPQFNRIIGEIHGKPGPSVIFTAGIHGNESSGVIALERAFQELKNKPFSLCGNIYFIAGNLQALNQNKRFISEDLNRMWTDKRLEETRRKPNDELVNEELEQKELHELLKSLIDKKQGPYYFMDLHTTSSSTIPFLTVNDSLLNRRFTNQYPLPTILGIEEYLSGPILSYLNELGYVAFGFEGGQHDDPSSINNHLAFVYLSLFFSEVIDLEENRLSNFINQLKPVDERLIAAFEIYHRHKIKPNEIFKMEPGFKNFQVLNKGLLLAYSNKREIRTTRRGRIFMPLYQNQGSDGFFAVQKIPTVFLILSGWIRTKGINTIFPILPGINTSNYIGIYHVNRNKARFLTKQLIHLFGYRIIERNPNNYLIQSRDIASKFTDYQRTSWI